MLLKLNSLPTCNTEHNEGLLSDKSHHDHVLAHSAPSTLLALLSVHSSHPGISPFPSRSCHSPYLSYSGSYSIAIIVALLDTSMFLVEKKIDDKCLLENISEAIFLSSYISVILRNPS